VEPTEPAVTTAALLTGGSHRLRKNPRIVGVFFLVGVLIAGIDFLRRGDPVPTASFSGIQAGTVSLRFGLLVDVVFRQSTPISALVDLQPRWLVWTVALELVRGGALVIASVYAYTQLLDETATLASAARYGCVMLVFTLAAVDIDSGLLLGLPLGIVAVYLVVRFAPVSALLATGTPIQSTFRASWQMTRGHGWSLFGVVLVVGLANHLLASIPLVGSVGSSLTAAVHVAVITAFVEHTST